MFYPLIDQFLIEEKKLVALIRSAVKVERIYRLCSSVSQVRTESIFKPTFKSKTHISHCWLLILVDKNNGNSCNYVQDKVENICRNFIPVTVIVMDFLQFNKWLMEGNRFAFTINEQALLLFDSGKIPVPPQAEIDMDEFKKSEQIYCEQGCDKVQEFLAGAELYKERSQNKMAAFMLHQAAEHALHTIFKRGTGLHINTHNIDKLLRYCAMVNIQVLTIISKDREGDKRLLELLQKSYIDARYKESFTIENVDLEQLSGKIMQLQFLMNEEMGLMTETRLV